jgi:hypothetical protein
LAFTLHAVAERVPTDPRFVERGTMEAFVRRVIQSLGACIRQLIYLYFFSAIIIWVMFRIFGINGWTWLMTYVVVIVLWWIKPVNWEGD